MTAHRFLPIPLELDEPERPPRWRCAGCGLEVRDPSPRLESCPASELDLDAAS